MQTAAKVSMIALAAMGVPVNAASSNADARAAQLVRQMTQEEKLSLVTSDMPLMMGKNRPAEAVIGAGYVAGVPRLGIPPLRETDASLGVANLMNLRRDDIATALPSTLSLASSWNPVLAHEAGAMIGAEARAKRFNVMLAGGVNLVREPRGGRSFEYPSEDPLLAGTIVGAQVAGIQSNGIISTIKHFAFNSQETGRSVVNAVIDEPSARESDLLAFQIALERGRPGSVMSAYNKVNGDWASENDWLLNQVLKRDWGFAGWVMSDWGNVHSTAKAALAGLDQQSGKGLDSKPFFGKPLDDAVASGEVPPARLDDMALRVVRSSIAAGLLDRSDVSEVQPIDYDANARVAQKAAEQGMVLLKNEGDLLPLPRSGKKIALIGPFAAGAHDLVGPWVVYGDDQKSVDLATGIRGALADKNALVVAQGSNVEEPLSGGIEQAVAAARQADVILLAIGEGANMSGEAQSRTEIVVPEPQQRLAEAVAAVGKPVVVILKHGRALALQGAVENAQAILATWFLGTETGNAIADVLFGAYSPSGRLPASFPRASGQEPYYYAHKSTGRPNPPGNLEPYKAHFRGIPNSALYPFGHGLTYGKIDYSGFTQSAPALGMNGTLEVAATITNRGTRAAEEVVQLYTHDRTASVTRPVRELKAFRKVALAPGQSEVVRFTLRAGDLNFYGSDGKLRVEPGTFDVWIAPSAESDGVRGAFDLTA